MGYKEYANPHYLYSVNDFFMQQRLTLITLGVAELKRSKDFYENTLGWKPVPNSNENIVFYKLNGVLLALFSADALAEDAGVSSSGSGFRKFTLAHNVGSEKEVDELVRLLESRGARVVKKPQKAFWGGYSSYVSDPDDILWEIAYNPFMSL